MVVSGCADPADPPAAADPSGVQRWSAAPHVRWAGPADPVRRPLAVLVDHPGGPLDRIAADPDVTTFLNDRFHPWFLPPEVAGGAPDAPATWWLDERGCLLYGPTRPATPEAWIADANAAALVHQRGDPATRALPLRPALPGLDPAHPLRGGCSPPDDAPRPESAAETAR